MQLADWLFTFLWLTADDPHGRSSFDVTRHPAAQPNVPVAPPSRNPSAP
jgi:hypothetical protein